jgi:hypothetical protein
MSNVMMSLAGSGGACGSGAGTASAALALLNLGFRLQGTLLSRESWGNRAFQLPASCSRQAFEDVTCAGGNHNQVGVCWCTNAEASQINVNGISRNYCCD